MEKREEIFVIVKSMLATCELVQNTPNARKTLEKYMNTYDELKACRLVYKKLADSYRGDETPESLGVSNFCQWCVIHFDAGFRISFPDSMVINDIAELYYGKMREMVVTDIRQQIQDWNIASDELSLPKGESIH